MLVTQFRDGYEYPVIIQSDRRILVREFCERTFQAASYASRIGKLVKSPGYFRTYVFDNVSLWNAMAMGYNPKQVISDLESVCRNELTREFRNQINEVASRYGKLVLCKNNGLLELEIKDLSIKDLVKKTLKGFIDKRETKYSLGINNFCRGEVKLKMIQAGYPVQDLAGFTQGASFELTLRKITRSEKEWSLYPEQQEDLELYLSSQGINGGSWVIEEPCGMGKTIIGIAAMVNLKTQTLILVPKTETIDHWKNELLDKTDVDESNIGEFSRHKKSIKPITIATYRSVTLRRNGGNFKHLNLFEEVDWGLIIYDEVHSLPAKLYQSTAQIQAKRRLGFSGSLVREEDNIENIFALIGPTIIKRSWKEAESKGLICEGDCNEIKIELDENLKSKIECADLYESNKIIAANPRKIPELMKILDYHSAEKDRRLIIGFHLKQLKEIADMLDLPLIYGKTSTISRNILYEMFNQGELDTLVLSKVGDESINLPQANVLIRVNGNGGSRLEEVQGFGRILRTYKNKKSFFYLLTTSGTREEEFSNHRKMFLIDQGYRYCIGKSLEEILEIREMPPLNEQKQRPRLKKEQIIAKICEKIQQKELRVRFGKRQKKRSFRSVILSDECDEEINEEDLLDSLDDENVFDPEADFNPDKEDYEESERFRENYFKYIEDFK